MFLKNLSAPNRMDFIGQNIQNAPVILPVSRGERDQNGKVILNKTGSVSSSNSFSIKNMKST